MQFEFETMILQDRDKEFKNAKGEVQTWREVLLDDPTGEPVSMAADKQLPRVDKYSVAQCRIELSKRDGKLKMRLVGIENVRKTILKAAQPTA